jgi:4-hydroxy-tetrahydrodipicolinate synthase
MKILSGTGVALVTPMDAAGKIDWPGLKKLIRHTAKVDYLVVMGTTGESATLTSEEKIKVLEFVAANRPASMPIVFGLGGNNTAELIQKLEMVRGLPLSAIMSVSPYYNKPSQEGIFRHFSMIADKSPLPVILYNVPSRTGSNVTAETTIRLSAHENIIAIKEASGNLEQAIRIISETPKKFKVICGEDMLTVPMMAVGASGVISVLANAFPGIFKKMTDAVLTGDYKTAARLQNSLIRINPLMYEEGNPCGIKEVLEQMGVIKNHLRLPLVPVSDSLRSKINKALQEIKKG